MSPRTHPLAPSDPLEAVWRALADPTRRALLDRLRERPCTTGELTEAFPQSRFAVMKHLDVLVAAGLVLVRRAGRERWNHLNPVPLQHMYERWVRPYEGLWAASLLRVRDAATSPPASAPSSLLLPPHTRTMPTTAPSGPTSAGMLSVSMEIPIAAAPSRVWEALTTQVSLWWPRAFLVAADRMQFDAQLGGRLFEQGTDGGGAVWYTVYAIVPGTSIDLVGQLSPAYGGPVQSFLRLVLREQGHVTVLELTDAVIGNVGEGSGASLSSGWRAIFDEGLRAFVEGV
jgi:DNA-binding transcriptional ArsR family regulator